MPDYTAMFAADESERVTKERNMREFAFAANKWKRQRDVAVAALLALQKWADGLDANISEALNKIAEIDREKFEDG